VKRLILLLFCCGLLSAGLLAATYDSPSVDSRPARSLAPVSADFAQPHHAFAGHARARDGDSIVVAGVPVRVWGIDAPEWRQRCRTASGRGYPCGRVAFRALARRLRAAPVHCVPQLRDKFERVVAVCYQGQDDIARWLVREGLALDWPRYSGGAYRGAEREARDTARGLWRGGFVRPWDWRHRRRWAAVTSRP
jgi:endonuclease YncB( thermonuclease family)